MIFSNGIPNEHGVKGRHFVNAHAWHTDDVSNMVHGADRQPAPVLPLGKVKQRDNLKINPLETPRTV